MARTGRPSKYNRQLAFEICRRIADGESMRAICREDAMPDRTTVLAWLSEHDEFSRQYAQARELQADGFVDEILEISDETNRDTLTREDGSEYANSEWINRSRLRVDSRKWIAARLAPKKYGDKVTQEHTGEGGGPIIAVIKDGA